MSVIEDLRSKFDSDYFEFTKHAVDQTILQEISVCEIRDAVGKSKIIEDYPDDKYHPSCLLLGFTKSNRPLHIPFSYPTRDLAKIVTVYEPDPARWIDYKIRR